MAFNKKIALAQLNPELGNIQKNALDIIKLIKKAENENADIIIFPELSITGSPLLDTIKRFPVIVENNLSWLNAITQNIRNISAVVGFIEKDKDGKLYNSAAHIRNCEIKSIIRKSQLSDLDKHFSICETQNIIEIAGMKCALFIGELKENIKEDVDLIINISASLSRNGVDNTNTLKEIAQNTSSPLIYVNQAGAIDNYSFAGASKIFSQNGQLLSKAKDFEEDFLFVNLSEKGKEIFVNNPISEPLNYEQDLERSYKTIIQGIRDYFKKNGLKRAVLGLSGGLDSSVSATLLSDALGSENVFGVSMPSKITSQESKDDAELLAKNLGIGFCVIPIKDTVDSFNMAVNPLFEKVSGFGSFAGERYKQSFTQDNFQARTRATILFAISNEFSSAIPIVTCDKSETYMGYATINGDMSGGFAPIDDITKTKLFALGRWLNKHGKIKNAIPESVLEKAPGAELAINPKTGKPLKAEEALMPYEFMDEIIWRIENKSQSYDEMLESEFIYEKKNKITKEQKTEWLDKFFKRMSTSIYKWSISAPSVIVEQQTINSSDYHQPICTGKINYKLQSKSEIERIIKEQISL